jgi:hypothetical protein
MISKILGVLIFVINFILLMYLKGKEREMINNNNNNINDSNNNNIDDSNNNNIDDSNIDNSNKIK